MINRQNDLPLTQRQKFLGHLHGRLLTFLDFRLAERVADAAALGLHEQVGHGPADEHLVHAPEQRFDETDLVRHLGAAE